MLNLSGFIQKSEQPREGEERQFKDGRYKFEGGKWNKIKLIDENKITTKKNEDDEYQVFLGSTKIGTIYRDIDWGVCWRDAENIAKPGEVWDILGDTKEEAIQTLIERYKKKN